MLCSVPSLLELAASFMIPVTNFAGSRFFFMRVTFISSSSHVSCFSAIVSMSLVKRIPSLRLYAPFLFSWHSWMSTSRLDDLLRVEDAIEQLGALGHRTLEDDHPHAEAWPCRPGGRRRPG